ncbi:MAG TPA: hypothetical protein PKK10_17410 [Woeseiaceae bacterium]|nr:hypothetical protein [Woeseiaceae bacterium]
MNHGASAYSFLDIVISIGALIVVLWAFYLAIRYTFWPGETSPDHIKRRILDDNDEQSR